MSKHRKGASLWEIASQLVAPASPRESGFVVSLKPESLLEHNPIELPRCLYKFPCIRNGTSGLNTIPKYSFVGIHVRTV